MSVDVPEEAFDEIAKAEKATLLLPVELAPPTGAVVSRFLAKAAVETMAHRLVGIPEGLEYLVDEAQLDPIRNHARRGTTLQWPTYTRRIYDGDAKWFGQTDDAVQMVHESDLLVTQSNEWYFVLALFGQEYAINIGGPEIDGYVRWLDENEQVSPLYRGKNAPGRGSPYRPAG